MLELTNVCKRYDTAPQQEPDYVLKDISWRIEKGDSAAITGPSGSGKSTLLNIIGTLDRPSAGEVLLDGRDLSQLEEVELAAIRNLEIGFVFQLHHLLPQCTVLENVLVPTLATPRTNNKNAVERAHQLLERIGLSRRLGYRPGQLSVGQRQRVAVARALINRPKLLLADEPTGSLDRTASETLMALLVELNRDENVTLIVATHSMELADRMDQVWTLTGGKLLSGKRQ
jgi:ABC-type lipoprotein export system ATPase subunit